LMDIHFDGKEGINAQHRGVLTRVWKLAFLQYGITGDKSTHSNPSPDFGTVLNLLESIADGSRVTDFFEFKDHVQSPDQYWSAVEGIGERIGTEDADLARELLRALEEFQEGGTCSNLNGQTNVDLQSRIVTMDMSAFADSGAMPLLMHVMLDWSYQHAKSKPNPMEIVFEEVHYLFNYEGARELMNLFFRHGRHFNAGLTLISQTVREFLRDDEVRDMYDQCPIKKIFYLENLTEDVIEYFDLTKAEQKFIQNAKKGDEHGVSNALLSVSGMGKRQLTIEFGEFKEHVLDDELDPWDYLIRYDDITREDVEWLAENDRLMEYRGEIPDDILEAASV